MEGEELQVIEDGDVEDWLKVAAFPLFFFRFQSQVVVLKPGVLSVSVQVCNSCGQVGYVPESYVQFLYVPAEGVDQSDGTFSSTSPSENEAGAAGRGQPSVCDID